MIVPVQGQMSHLNSLTTPTVDEVKKTFLQGPGKDFSTAPLWVWNDLLSEQQIRDTLRELAGQEVKQAFIHPRPGLMTPYLSEDWFRLWRVALDESKKLGMNLWIYDENSYPSGFAGGFVPDQWPESRAKGLAFQNVKSLKSIDNDVLFVYEIQGNNQYKNITEKAKKDGTLSQGNWLIARLQYAPTGDWFAGKFYVDLLKKGVTEKFIDLTHQAYKKELGSTFGTGIRGIFTDEPHIAPFGQIKWTEDLPKQFELKYHYSLIDVLPLLTQHGQYKISDGRVVDWKEVRHNFYQTLLNLFIERWSKPNFEFCEKNGLQYTGHYWEHGWPNILHGPDPMAMYVWHHRPAIDMLMNDRSDSVNAQFGNIRAVRELSSVANQLGRSQRLSETYGAGGWDLRFEDMKRIGDWQYALGVTATDEHLSYITIRGARKHDHPQSFSYHASWWSNYHVIAKWHTRMSWLLSQGRQANPLLILQPTTTMWCYQYEQDLTDRGQAFANFIQRCEGAQVEYDLGSEDILDRLGSVEKKNILTVGKAEYSSVLLPEGMENLNRATLLLLEKYVKNGGVLYRMGQVPQRIEGMPVNLSDKMVQNAFHFLFGDEKDNSGTAKQIKELSLWNNIDMTLPLYSTNAFKQAQKDKNIKYTDSFRIRPTLLYHHRRRFIDGEMIFICNTDIENTQSGCFCIPSDYSIEVLDPLNGTADKDSVLSVDINADSGKYTSVAFELPPCGGRVWLLKRDKNPIRKPSLNISEITISAKKMYPPRRMNPNTLVIDYCSLKMKDKEIKDAYFFNINEELWKSFGFSANPWRSAVQFKDELIKRNFEKGKGFSVSYRFKLDAEYVKGLSKENPLEVVIEKAVQYKITCNGKCIQAKEDEWWLDKSFGKINLNSVVQVGDNELTIQRDTMNMYCEIMPIFLLGNFTLQTEEQGFIVKKELPLVVEKPWNMQGLPFYSYDVSYREDFDVALKQNAKYYVKLPRIGNLENVNSKARWNGSVARVIVNDRLAGHIIAEPCQLEVGSLLKNGLNKVEVVITGTPKNVFGPFHAGKMRGRAWPNAFTTGPKCMPYGDKYDTIPYGLLDPFVLNELLPY